MHLSHTSIGDFLVQHLKQQTALPCKIATEGALIEKGPIYIAWANFHLLIKKENIILGHGPEEKRWRPSVNVLFRSGAAANSNPAIGIVLMPE